jgi:hypothetical protein
MFCWTEEGARLKTGFNVYRLNDPNSSGFKFKFWRFCYMWRYSWKTKTIHKHWVYVNEMKLPGWARRAR